MRLPRYALSCGTLFALLASGLAAADPAHYIVFELDGEGRAQPVYYAQVDIALAASDTPRAKQPTAPDSERIVYHPLRGGVDLGERSLDVPLLAGGEFARDPKHGDGTIEAVRATPTQRSFVLRVPIAQADSVEFMLGGKRQRVDLGEIAARAPSLALARYATPRATQATSAGNPANRVDLLVLGDGYTAAQQAKFDTDAAVLHDSYFNLTPYKEYASFVNWMTGFVASSQSGADHPAYQAGCTRTTCCSDASAQDDPLAGQAVNTAFDARYCSYQTQRLLTVNTSKVFAAAAAWPNWDMIVLVVNDTTYGGSGGTMPVTSVDPDARQIVLHEYGHSFTHLADEYDYDYPGFPGCSDASGSATCEANVTDRDTVGTVKWASWFTAGNPIPTPAGSAGVGLFQGARYRMSGMYRSADQCLMKTLGKPFCPVCRQEYVLSLYRGGFGEPDAGIDLIEPGSETPSPGGDLDYAARTPQRFQATLLVPSIGSLDRQWYLDGQPIAGATGASTVFQQATLLPATHTLELRVTDTTPYVSAAMSEGLLVHSRQWTLHVIDDLIFRNGYE